MRKIAFFNQKGGVGKTTSTVNLAVALGNLGRKVLLVDMDPQANATRHLGFDPNELDLTMFEVLQGKVTPKEAIKRVEGIDCLPATPDMADLEVDIFRMVNRSVALKKALAKVTGYDYVLIDCPPSPGVFSLNARAYADEIIVPVEAKYLGMIGLADIMDTIALDKEQEINPTLKVSGIIITMNNATNLAADVSEEVEKHFPGLTFSQKINSSVFLSEAPSAGQSIHAYRPGSPGSIQYNELARIIDGGRKSKKA